MIINASFIYNTSVTDTNLSNNETEKLGTVNLKESVHERIGVKETLRNWQLQVISFTRPKHIKKTYTIIKKANIQLTV